MARWKSFVYLELQDTLDSNPNTRNRKTGQNERRKGRGKEGGKNWKIHPIQKSADQKKHTEKVIIDRHIHFNIQNSEFQVFGQLSFELLNIIAKTCG